MARSSLQLDVGDLRRQLGQKLDVTVDVKLEPLQVVSSRSTDASVLGQLVLESVERGVSVSGSVTFGWESECRRCLDALEGTGETTIDEVFQYMTPENSDFIDFDGEHVDLLPLVRDAVMASLPLSPLCRDDCQGPDPERYPALSASELEALAAEEKGPDPRWAGLEGLKLD